MKLIYILLLMIFTINFAASQNLSTKEKIKRELKLLANYSLMDRTQKIETCKDLLFIWFDTSRYDMKMVHNQKGDPYEYKKLDMRIAGLLENKNDRYDQQLLFFDEENGKIKKIIDLEKINPYTKSKTPKLDKNLNYHPEYMDHVPKMDENGNIRKIDKFVSKNFGGRWDYNHLIWSFRKYGLDSKNQVIDEWDTFVVFDSLGNIIMNHEFNDHCIRYTLNQKATFFLIEIFVEGWDKEGFSIYDINNRKIFYRYSQLVNNPENYCNGANFSNNNFMFFELTYKNGLGRKIFIIDLINRSEFNYYFANEIWEEIIKNWEFKYKSFENLITYFEFKSRSF